MSSRGSDTVSPLGRPPGTSSAERLETFLSGLRRQLRRQARGRLPAGVRAINDTSDIVQDVLTRILAGFDLFKPAERDALSAYLLTAVRHRIVDEHRRADRWRYEQLDARWIAETPSPLQQAEQAETWRRYRAALATLGGRDQELIVAFLELDYSHAQLACMIGRTPHAARMALTRAMARLASRMDAG